jgi:hypothetical protein
MSHARDAASTHARRPSGKGSAPKSSIFGFGPIAAVGAQAHTGSSIVPVGAGTQIVNAAALPGFFLRCVSSVMRAPGAMSSMIEIMPDAGAGVTLLRFRGVQTSEDITGAVVAVIQLCDGRDGIRLLCDWSDVLGWACATRSLPVYEWGAAASGRIERAAILHHHRWNRQAAWLAAMLRHANVEVRCWRLRASDEARKWLLAPCADSGPA